jgi:hypothetical protein
MCEVCVHGQGFDDSEVLHHHETQAVHKAVRLVLMPFEVGERGALYLFRIKLLTDSGSFRMSDLQRQRDRFRNDVIGR